MPPLAPFKVSPTGSLSTGAAPQTSFPAAPVFTPNLNGGSQFGTISGGGLPQSPSILPTSTGGISFDSSLSSGFKPAAQNTTQNTAATQPSRQSLSDFVTNSSPTAGGGSLMTDGNGSPTGFNPNYGFQIGTSGAIPSSALTTNNSLGDLQQSHGQYMDYVNALAQAQGYSPQYLQALNQQYGAQTQGAALNLNSAQLNSNLYTGNDLPGDTMNYAQGATAKAQAQNTLAQGVNAVQQLGANQTLNTAQLARTGNIASAQAQLQYNPVAVSGENALNQYNALQQQYPNAAIPAYNSSLSPAENQQLAQQAVAQSPAYQAQFQGTYTTPGGGLSTYNKLNPDGGGSELVSGADAATGAANASSLATQTQNYNSTQSAFNTANKTLGTMIQFMNQNGINDNSVPILNQLENKAKAGLISPGVVAAYNADIAELQTNYAQILSRGGSVAGTNDEANSLINPNLKPADLQKVLGELTRNGQNALDALGGQISTIKSQLGGSSSQSANSDGWY